MKWFSDLKIGTRILTGYFIVAIFTAIASKATAMMILAVIAGVIAAIVLGLLTSRSIIKPIKKAADLADQIARGDVNDINDITFPDNETGSLSKSLARIVANMKEKAEAAQKIASGDLSFELKLLSDKDNLGISMNSVIDTLENLEAEAEYITASILEGNLDSRGNAEKFNGGYKAMIEGMNQTIDALVHPLVLSSEYIEKIGNGNIPSKITSDTKGDFKKIKDNINICIDSFNALVKDAEMLSSQTLNGELSFRADSAKHSGDYAKIIGGMNRTLDSVIKPLNVAAGHIEQIGKGEIPEKITEEYKGQFNVIKNSINSCIDGLDGLVEGKDVLKRMKDNDFSAKVKGNYLGIYAEMAESINMISDRILHIIDILSEISDGNLNELPRLKSTGKKCENDTLLPTIVTMMENIKDLVDETIMLSNAAVEGKLAARGEAEKFNGEYAKVIEGINKTLNAVIEPVSEASEVLQEMAKGNLHAAMEGNYRGDHAAIKNTMNETVNSIRSYMDEIANVLSEISSGNLDLTIKADYKGDYLEIKDSLNNIIRSLSQVMNNFENAAEQVSSGSRQVSDGSQTLAQGSTEQASSIQELTASISEIAEQSKDNAIKANEVYQLAKGARDGGAKGNLTMNEMLKSMEDINKSSENISKIIKVIDDIAFQTNILALNAAVEAARAGSHGKGFAVVAEEVRNLAARSAKAAEETTELIEGSIQKVQIGTKITNEIAAVLKEIADGAVLSTEKLSIISKASNEQASGIAQINQGIEQISRVIQSNSATAEQSAAASEELSGQAELLKEMVSKFKVSGKLSNVGLLTDNGSQVEQPKIYLSSNEYDKY